MVFSSGTAEMSSLGMGAEVKRGFQSRGRRGEEEPFDGTTGNKKNASGKRQVLCTNGDVDMGLPNSKLNQNVQTREMQRAGRIFTGKISALDARGLKEKNRREHFANMSGASMTWEKLRRYPAANKSRTYSTSAHCVINHAYL